MVMIDDSGTLLPLADVAGVAGPADADDELEGSGRRGVTCRLCGRPLTGRDARRRGIGDGCRAKLHERVAPRPPARDIEQDTLPGL